MASGSSHLGIVFTYTMNIKTICTDRKAMAHALAAYLGTTVEYLRTPPYAFRVGIFRGFPRSQTLRLLVIVKWFEHGKRAGKVPLLPTNIRQARTVCPVMI